MAVVGGLHRTSRIDVTSHVSFELIVAKAEYSTKDPYFGTTVSYPRLGLRGGAPKTATEVGTAPTMDAGIAVAPMQFSFDFEVSNLLEVSFGTGVTGGKVMGSTVAEVRSATQGLLCVKVWSVGGSIDPVGFFPRREEVRGVITPGDTRLDKPLAVGRPGVGEGAAGTPACANPTIRN